uniref:RNA polymerase II-associated factor 1 homolog n=1 Tax=Chelydra serpentina TaxID=8475 RepID=A0A8C3SVH3_CHESE
GVVIIDCSYLFLCLRRPNAHRTLPERSGVVCRVKYCNSLPDIPFDPKFITYPFDQNRFVQYKATSLEKQHKHDLLTEPDLGVTIDLINPDTYRIDPNVLLDPADEKLLEEEVQAPTSSKRSQQHAKVVPWMRKTEYISTEFNRYGVSNEKPEVKIGVSVKQQFTEEEIYKDRDSQIAAIEKTFEDAQKSIAQHYSKPRVTPMEVMPVFPDFKMWINPCAQVIFDSDPAPKDTSGVAALEMMSQAMIRQSPSRGPESRASPVPGYWRWPPPITESRPAKRSSKAGGVLPWKEAPLPPGLSPHGLLLWGRGRGSQAKAGGRLLFGWEAPHVLAPGRR